MSRTNTSADLQRLSPEFFENRLSARLLHAPDPAGADDPVEEARNALKRLSDNPSLRVLTEPNGPVFYEDPLLDSAWTCAQEASAAGVSPAAEGEDLDNRLDHWIPFIIPLIRGRISRNWDVLASKGPATDVQMALPLRLAIVGDAGYRGLAQRAVLGMIERRQSDAKFDILLHLGDTYHGGDEAEFLRHLVVPFSNLKNHLGIRVFSLIGNHDLYAGPDGFLAALAVFGQPGRFFVIEAGGWRLALLDSALGDTSRWGLKGRLDDAQLSWLQQKQSAEPKRLVLFTHHLPRSAWDIAPSDLLAQLQRLPNLCAWYWGHEHRCAAYDSTLQTGFAGGCIGNGAFLEHWAPPVRQAEEKLSWFPEYERCTCYGEEGRRYWPHGYMELELRSDRLVERFFVENAKNAPASERTLS